MIQTGDRVRYAGPSFPGSPASTTLGTVESVRFGDAEPHGVTLYFVRWDGGFYAWLTKGDLEPLPSTAEMVEELSRPAEDAPKITVTAAAGSEGFASILSRLLGRTFEVQTPESSSLLNGRVGLLKWVDEREEVATFTPYDEGAQDYVGPDFEVELTIGHLTFTYL